MKKNTKILNLKLTPEHDTKLRQIAANKGQKLVKVVTEGIELQWKPEMNKNVK